MTATNLSKIPFSAARSLSSGSNLDTIQAAFIAPRPTTAPAVRGSEGFFNSP